MPTPICQMLGIEYPIFAFSHCRDVVAAVSRVGGFGVLGATTYEPEDLEMELSWLDENCGGRPYGLDLLFPAKSEGNDVAALAAGIPQGHRDFEASVEGQLGIPSRKNPGTRSAIGGMPKNIDHLPTNARARAQWDVAREHPFRLLASALGPAPSDVIRAAHGSGALVAGLVGEPRHAAIQLEVGADILIAQGYEAAGHTGDVGTFVLVPQIVDMAGANPVLAAGGVAEGRQVAAALALGAQGVWTGSLWLTTAESDLDPIVKRRLIEATSGDTFKTRYLTGKPTRHLLTPFIEAWEEDGSPEPLPSPLQQILVRDALVSAGEHGIESAMGTAAGQVIGLIKAERSAESVVFELATGMAQTFEEVSALFA